MIERERIHTAMCHLNALQNNGGRTIYGQWLADLMALLPDLAARNSAMHEALTDIAQQKKTDELETEYDAELADFETGYDTIIDVARKALNPSS